MLRISLQVVLEHRTVSSGEDPLLEPSQSLHAAESAPAPAPSGIGVLAGVDSETCLARKVSFNWQTNGEQGTRRQRVTKKVNVRHMQSRKEK